MNTFRKYALALVMGLVVPALVVEYSHADAPQGQYTITADTVRDTKSQLTWERNSGLYTYAEAEAHCKNLNLENATWRVPTMKELLTIVDDTRTNPSIDINAFPNTPSTQFWTSSERVNQPGEYWHVDFYDGGTSSFDPTQTINLRCVR